MLNSVDIVDSMGDVGHTTASIPLDKRDAPENHANNISHITLCLGNVTVEIPTTTNIAESTWKRRPKNMYMDDTMVRPNLLDLKQKNSSIQAGANMMIEKKQKLDDETLALSKIMAQAFGSVAAAMQSRQIQ